MVYRLIFITIAIFFFACSEPTRDNSDLCIAESVMEENPDSALTILESLKYESLNSSDKAKCALLLTQARYKNYIDETNDSLINYAVEYYTRSDDYVNTMKAYFYQAIIYTNCKKYDNSIVTLMKAEEAAKILNDNYYLGMIYRQMSILYSYSYNSVKSLYYSDLAYKAFSKTTHDLHRAYAFLSLANAYSDVGQYNKADSIYNKILSDETYRSNANLIGQCCLAYSCQLMSLNQYEKAKIYIYKSNNYGGVLSVQDYCNLANIYMVESKLDSVPICFYFAENSLKTIKDSLLFYHAKYNFDVLNNDFDKGFKDFEVYNSTLSNIVDNSLKQSVANAQNSNLTAQISIREAKLDAERLRSQVYLLISFCCLCLLLSTIWITYRYVNGKREYVQSLMSEANKIKDINNRVLEQTSNMKTDIIRLIQSRVQVIDEMCNIYIDSQVSEKTNASESGEIGSYESEIR
jgi:tetratricopeptide (TPR) repeat protein